jgi:hypothetical protein
MAHSLKEARSILRAFEVNTEPRPDCVETQERPNYAVDMCSYGIKGVITCVVRVNPELGIQIEVDMVDFLF